jgi:transposase
MEAGVAPEGVARRRRREGVDGNVKGVEFLLKKNKVATFRGTGTIAAPGKVTDDARYDGLWVLRTNTTLRPRYVALAYKQLWTVEATFRAMKSVLDTRPIFHRRDDTIRGHVFCSFLALLLRQELQRRLAERQWTLEWAHVIDDLDALHETTITLDTRAYVVRSEAKGTVGKVFQACGVALPPVLRSIEAS